MTILLQHENIRLRHIYQAGAAHQPERAAERTYRMGGALG